MKNNLKQEEANAVIAVLKNKMYSTEDISKILSTAYNGLRKEINKKKK